MNRNVFLALFYCGVIVVASPLRLLADKMEERYKHASGLLSQGDFQSAQTEFEAILRKKHDYRSAKVADQATLGKARGLLLKFRNQEACVPAVLFEGFQ